MLKAIKIRLSRSNCVLATLASLCSPKKTKKKIFCPNGNFQNSKLTDRREADPLSSTVRQENQSHTGSLGEEKINISTISSGQESHAPQDGFRWIPEFASS